MDNWNDSDFKIPKTSVPKDVFEEVKSKMITRRKEAKKTHQQMVVGSLLLLILGMVNMSIALHNYKEKPKTMAEQAEIIRETYFKIQNNLFQ